MVTTRPLYKFIIDGVDVTTFVLPDTKIERTKVKNNGNTADIHLSLAISTIITLESGMYVTIQRGVLSATEHYIFKGDIKTIQHDDDYITVSCKDILQRLNFMKITKSYDINIDPSAGVISEIFKDITQTYGKLNASVMNSGNLTVLTKFICKNEIILDKLSELARLIDWVIYYDYDTDVVMFQPNGYTTYPTTLNVGTNVFNILSWNDNIDNMINKVTVNGAYQLDTRVNNFTGDGGTKTFTLSYTPESTEVTVSGILKTRGVINQTTAFDYSVDRETMIVTFINAPAGAAPIVVTYQTKIPYPVVGIASDSVARFGLVQEETFTFNDIVNINDAENRMNSILNLLKWGEISVDVLTNEFQITEGMAVTITDNYNPQYNGKYFVRSLVTTYPEPYDVVTIGTFQFNISDYMLSITERLKALEEGNTTYSEILRQIFNLTRLYDYERRYTILQKDDLSSFNGTIFDNPINNGFDDNNYGFDGTGDVLTNSKITQFNNTYKEFVYDIDFKDATSTATWNITTKQLEFTSGQFILTSCFSKGPIYSYCTIKLGDLTGSVLVEISADGKNTWQTPIINARVPILTSTSDGVFIRITENNSSTATIKNTYFADGSYNLPAIKCILEE